MDTDGEAHWAEMSLTARCFVSLTALFYIGGVLINGELFIVEAVAKGVGDTIFRR